MFPMGNSLLLSMFGLNMELLPIFVIMCMLYPHFCQTWQKFKEYSEQWALYFGFVPIRESYVEQRMVNNSNSENRLQLAIENKCDDALVREIAVHVTMDKKIELTKVTMDKKIELTKVTMDKKIEWMDKKIELTKAKVEENKSEVEKRKVSIQEKEAEEKVKKVGIQEKEAEEKVRTAETQKINASVNLVAKKCEHTILEKEGSWQRGVAVGTVGGGGGYLAQAASLSICKCGLVKVFTTTCVSITTGYVCAVTGGAGLAILAYNRKHVSNAALNVTKSVGGLINYVRGTEKQKLSQ